METVSSPSRNARSSHSSSHSQKYLLEPIPHDGIISEELHSLRRNIDCDVDVDHAVVGSVTGRKGHYHVGAVATPACREDWDDAATAITGATSEFAYSACEDDHEPGSNFLFARYSGPAITAFVGSFGFLSPIAMVVLPKIGVGKWNIEKCDKSCQAILFGLGFRLVLLLAATCGLFLRSPRSTMPRIFVFRSLVIFLVFVLTFTFWLFYVVHVYFKFGSETEKLKYEDVATFAMSLADVLMFVHYLAVILIELRQLNALYAVRIIRSPDGESRSYSVGRFSIQRLAVWCLEQYYRDFQIYNPYLDSLPHRAAPYNTNFKLYDIDGARDGVSGVESAMSSVGSRQPRDLKLNERVYEEQDYERRVSRRRSRLLTAAEDAFTLVHRLNNAEHENATTMSCDEAAQAIFPSIERPLRKYLRVTRQQPWHSRDSVIDHLAHCIRNDMSARAFLEPFLTQTAVVWSARDYASTQTWTIVCNNVVSRSAEHGTMFQLCQGDVVLSVVVRQLPHVSVKSASYCTSRDFALHFNSETSV